jgi:hypothetical protein
MANDCINIKREEIEIKKKIGCNPDRITVIDLHQHHSVRHGKPASDLLGLWFTQLLGANAP